MNIQELIRSKVIEAAESMFDVQLTSVEFQPTRKDFEGDVTVVIFPMLRQIKGNPVQIGQKIGNYLVSELEEIDTFNVIKGFLNLTISDSYYINFFNSVKGLPNYGRKELVDDRAVLVEYSSPNTNKPLHLGHIRNNLLGYSVAEILKANGRKVYKTQIINDRGIHICKSMLAWSKYGNGETPENSKIKGDKLAGKYYVMFDQKYKEEVANLVEQGIEKQEAEKIAPILNEAQAMLLKWESGDQDTVALWKKMNSWVYKGFDATYEALGVNFDKLYYESDTYLLGKDVVAEGLEKGVFFKKEDGSVWIDLTDEGLDEKIVLRADGTAVYMTQDIGTAIQRVKDFPDIDGMVYTVGNEQDYHFKVLFLILKKLGFAWAQHLYHLSYGMVDLPQGKMKSREGTVVDADDLMVQMENTAAQISEELGKLDAYSEEDKRSLYRTIGLGALKYYILKVDPKKRILFNPEESVDFQGNTGPFIQYTYARIQSILRKSQLNDIDFNLEFSSSLRLDTKEKELLKLLETYPLVIDMSGENLSPALLANYTYDLVKEFNSFYQQVPILGETDKEIRIFRIQLAKTVGEIIKASFLLLGIEVPSRM
ncbi:MAG: arginine--tRNA ligase [Eudoraea sp.]|uniref:arginine--tRNA ligase n=1 Tax=Eudoraea sp. TaxID=1979955 RepID=UPI003C72486A